MTDRKIWTGTAMIDECFACDQPARPGYLTCAACADALGIPDVPDNLVEVTRERDKLRDLLAAVAERTTEPYVWSLVAPYRRSPLAERPSD